MPVCDNTYSSIEDYISHALANHQTCPEATIGKSPPLNSVQFQKGFHFYTKRALRDVLRVDKKFRTYGPEEQKKEYHKRPPIEAVNSFLKTQYGMVVNKVRGLKRVASYAMFSILCLILNREAAEKIGRSDKAVSPTYFNT